MDWIEPEAFGLVCPAFADVFVGCQPVQRLEATPEIVGFDEVLEGAGGVDRGRRSGTA